MNPADQLGWRGCERIGGLGYKILVEDRGPEAEANTGQRVSVGTKILDDMFVIYVTTHSDCGLERQHVDLKKGFAKT